MPEKYHRVVSLCSGIGGLDAAAEQVFGKGCTSHLVEINPDCRKLLEARFPESKLLEDMSRVGALELGTNPFLMMGGPPCQAFSLAGRRGGLSDARGNLTLDYVRLSNELDPEYILYENVPGLLSSKDNAFGHFLAELVGCDAPLISSHKRGRWPDAGLVAGPKRVAAWRCLDAQFFGLAQRRKRVFVLAGRDPGNFSVAKILFESQSGSRHPSTGRVKREDIATTLRSRSARPGINPPGRGGEDDANIVLQPLCIDGQNSAVLRGDICGTLQGEAMKRQSTGHMVAVPFGSGKTSGPQDVSDSIKSHHFRNDFESETIIVGPLASGTDKGDQDPLVQYSGMGVRRLTPTETLRLQGFPDSWLDGLGFSDSKKYRMVGNSVAVPVIKFILQRLHDHHNQK